jgi:hypothetical protein
MTDFEFTALSRQDKVEVLSTSDFIALNNHVFAILFLVDDFFVEACYDIHLNLLATTTFSSSTVLPKTYLDMIVLDDLLR